MKNNIHYCIVSFLCLNIGITYCQTKEQLTSFVKLDSLVDVAYDNAQWDNCFSYSNKQLILAKSIKDSAKVGRAFYNIISCLDDSNLAIAYADSMISYTKYLKNTKHLAKAYMLKSDYQAYLGQYSQAIQNLYRAEVLAENSKLPIVSRSVIKRIANLKTIAGEYQESLDLYKKYYQLIVKEIQSEKKVATRISPRLQRNHLIAYNNLAQGFMYLNQIDSAKNILNQAISKLDVYQVNNPPNLFELNAEVDYALGNSNKSEIYFLQQIKTATPYHLATSYYYLGKINIDAKRYTEGITFLLKMDSVAQTIHYDNTYRKDAYKILNSTYEQLGNTKLQLEAINNYLELDSLETVSKQIISPFVENNFDKTKQLKEKAQLLNQIKAKDKTIKIYFFFLIPITLFLVYFLNERRKLQKRIKSLQESGLVIKSNPVGSKHTISKEKIALISEVLKTFQEQKSFLNPKLTQETLAKTYQTNSTDLSIYINTILGVNFSTYLSQIRIQHAIEQLNNDPSLDKYSMSGLASLFGFNNSNTFSRSFMKITGVKPSVYRKSISYN